MTDKERERYYFAAFREAVQGLPTCDAEELEPPDFLLRTSQQRLGIELTTFFLGPAPGERPHQEQQSLKERIVNIAERLHAEAGGPALYVGIHFSHRLIITKADTNRIAKSIAECVLKAPMPRSMNEPVELQWHERPREIWGVQIHPSVDGRDKLWHADSGGWIAEITPAHVKQVIAKKARTAAAARKHCDQLWLIIVEDNFGLGAQAEITPEALRAEYSGPFDRVYWLSVGSPPRARALTLTQLPNDALSADRVP